MKQTIVRAYPPNIEAIAKVYPNAMGKGVIFSYGDRLFNPTAVQIPKQLIAHEGEHGRRQEAAGVEAWWNRYLTDRLFMLDEEIYAHHAEWKCALRHIGPGAIRAVAQRLAGPLYGNVISYEQALRAIQTGEVR